MPSSSQPLDAPGYSFREDYVSGWTALWTKFLEPFKGRENVRLLEIGSFEGRSAIWFLENILTHSSSSIVCLDCFESCMEEAFDRNMAVCPGAHRMTKVSETSDSYLSRVSASAQRFDIIYVDGSHEAVHVLFDGMAGWRLLEPGGVMIFDDYGWEPDFPPHHRPQIAIDLFLEARQSELELLHHEYQLIVRKKGSPR